MSDRDPLRTVFQKARRTTLRLVAGRALTGFARTLPVPLIYALAALCWIKVAPPSEFGQRILGVGLLVAVLVPLVVAALHGWAKRPELWGAQVLDRHHGLSGRLANAIAFSREANPTALQRLAIEDAIAHGAKLDPRRAAPLRWPPELFVSAGLLLALVGLAQLEVHKQRFVPAPMQRVVAVELPADDLAVLRQNAELFEQTATDPEALAAARRFNQIVEDLAARRLDQREVLERLAGLERSLLGQSALDREALEESLRSLATELSQSSLTKPAAQALDDKKLADAEQALAELAKRLRDKPATLSKAELERLRKALERAGKQNDERAARIEEQRRQLEAERQQLLQKKNEKPNQALDKNEQRELERKERQLKQLDRQKQRADRGKQQMSALDRELAQAAADLMKELGDAARHLEQGARDLNRMAQKQLSDSEKQALKKQLEELRQMLRQNQGGSEQRKQLLERFRQKAGGGQTPKEQAGGQPGQGQPGGAKPGSLQLGPGQGQGPAIPVPGGKPQGQGSSGGEATGGPSAQAGTDRNSQLRGEASELAGKTRDVSAAGIDSGQGQSTSEVVYGAAERGFAGNGYRKVYTDYKTVAEEVMQTEQIPPGYRFYVRRYFQLIRPRD